MNPSSVPRGQVLEMEVDSEEGLLRERDSMFNSPRKSIGSYKVAYLDSAIFDGLGSLVENCSVDWLEVTRNGAGL